MKLRKYTYRSPLFGSISSEELFPDTDGIYELSPEAMARMYDRHYELSRFLEKEKECLEKYVPDKFLGTIIKAEFGDYGFRDGKMWLYTHIWTIDDLTDSGIEEIADWIEGQMSDGWGEGLEQREWKTDTEYVRSTVFDEYSCSFEEEDVSCQVYYYVDPWNSRDFELIPEDVEIEEWEDGKVVGMLELPDKKLEILKFNNFADLDILLSVYDATGLKQMVKDRGCEDAPVYVVKETVDGVIHILTKYAVQIDESPYEVVLYNDGEYKASIQNVLTSLLK